MDEISGPHDTGCDRMFHVPSALVIEWGIPASHMRENAAGQFSRRYQDAIDDVLSCFDRVLRTARELCQKKKISHLCSTDLFATSRLQMADCSLDEKPSTLDRKGENV